MRYVKGSVIDAKEQFIVHGVNARGYMGAGVAKAIRDKWPHVHDDYLQGLRDLTPTLTPFIPMMFMGRYFMSASLDDSPTVVSLIIQDDINRRGEKWQRQVNYSALIAGMSQFLTWNMPREVAIPKIGCGLAGGSWTIVGELLCDLEAIYQMEFVVYEP